MLLKSKLLVFIISLIFCLSLPFVALANSQSDYIESITDDTLVTITGMNYPTLYFNGLQINSSTKRELFIFIPPSAVQDILISESSIFIPSNINCYLVSDYDCFLQTDGSYNNFIMTSDVMSLIGNTFDDLDLQSCYFPDSITTYSTYDDDELLSKIDELKQEIINCQSNSSTGEVTVNIDETNLLDKIQDIVFLIQAQNTWILYIIAVCVGLFICILLYNLIMSCMTY